MVQFPRNLGGVYPSSQISKRGTPPNSEWISPSSEATWHLKSLTFKKRYILKWCICPLCFFTSVLFSVKTLVKKTSSNTTPTTTLALLFFNQTTVTWRRSKLLRWCRSFRSQSVKGTKLRAWSSTSAPLFLEWLQNIGLIGAMMNAYLENYGEIFFGKVCFGGDVGWAKITPTVVNHW